MPIIINETTYAETDCGVESLTFRHQTVKDPSSCQFRAILTAGLPLPMLPYSVSRFIYSSPVGTITSDSALSEDPPTSGDQDCTAAAGIGATFVDDEQINAEAKALSQAASNYYGSLSGVRFESVVAVGELRETVNMVSSTARRLAHSIKSLKKLDIDGAFNALKMGGGSHRQSLKKRKKRLQKENVSNEEFAANSWLEMKYGWEPLLTDVDRAVERLAEQFRKDPASIRAVGGAKIQYALSPNNVNIPARIITGSGTGSVKVGIIGYYSIKDPKVRDQHSLGLNNLNSAAYELTPFSFIIDWFLPIGDYLSALGATNGLKYERGCTSVKKFKSWGGTCTQTSLYHPASLSDSSRQESFRRNVGVPPPEAILRFRSIGEAMGLSNITTSMALLVQAVK